MGSFDAAREVDRVVVDRVRTGTESPTRMTVGEFIRNLGAGIGPQGPRPTSQKVPVYLEDVEITVTRGYQDPTPGRVRYGNADFAA